MSLFYDTSFEPSYLSLDEISATQLKVPCKTLIRLGRFGYLDPTAGQGDLPEGTTLELPLWAATALVKRGYASVQVPQKYRGMYREMLKADPTMVDLSKIAPYFYQSGLHVSSLPTPESAEIAEILPDVLQKRLSIMVDSFSFLKEEQTAGETVLTGKLMCEQHMDELERRLFKSSKKSAEAIAAWMKDEETY